MFEKKRRLRARDPPSNSIYRPILRGSPSELPCSSSSVYFVSPNISQSPLYRTEVARGVVDGYNDLTRDVIERCDGVENSDPEKYILLNFDWDISISINARY